MLSLSSLIFPDEDDGEGLVEASSSSSLVPEERSSPRQQ